MSPDLQESAWTRAVRQSAVIYKSAAFGLAVALAEAVVVPLTVLVTAHSSRTEVQIAVPILAGALTLTLALVGTFVVQLTAASVQQRNELRAGWTTAPAAAPPNPEIQLLNFARIGEEKAEEVRRREVGPTARQQADVEEWTNAVVDFLEAHLPDRGREFLDAGRNWGADSRNLHLRISEKARKLREIAADLSSDPNLATG